MSAAEDDTKKAIVRRELENIRRAHGAINPEVIVREASSSKHPLHRYFEWDDRKAAHEHRLQQAYQMILASRMTVIARAAAQAPPGVVKAHPVQQQVRGYVNTAYGCGFVSRTEVLANDELRRALVAKKLRELQGWCESVADIAELTNLRLAVIEAMSRNSQPEAGSGPEGGGA